MINNLLQNTSMQIFQIFWIQDTIYEYMHALHKTMNKVPVITINLRALQLITLMEIKFPVLGDTG